MPGPVYNDPTIGQGFSNLAQMFAPPSGADVAGYTSAAVAKAKAARDALLFQQAGSPNFDQTTQDREQIANGMYTPMQSMFAQNQNTDTTRRGQDLQVQSNIDNSLLAPVGQGQTRFVPPSIAAAANVPQTEIGDVLAQPGERISTPDGRVIEGAPRLLSQDQVNAQIEQSQLPNMSNDDLKAIAMGNTPVEAVAGPDGKPVNVTRPNSVGQQPVSVQPGAGAAYDNKIAGDLATDATTIQAGAQKAQDTLATISAMRQQMSDPSFYSGPIADQIEVAKRFAAALGIDPAGVSSMEQFQALSNQLVVNGLNGSLGTGVSNADRVFIGATKPNIHNTPAGNAALLNIMQKLAQRQIEIADWADQYKAGHNGRLDPGWASFERQQADQNPLFPQQGANGQPATGAPTAGGVQEGATATNKATGQTIVYHNGQWEPAT